MKITIIRHGNVNMQWQRKYNSQTFYNACIDFDKTPIYPLKNKHILSSTMDPIFISEQIRTRETAAELFGSRNFAVTPLLNEVPLMPFVNTNKKMPLCIWYIMARLQWLLQMEKQPEGKQKTILRARDMILKLEIEGKDCSVISHGFFIRVLIKELKRDGYQIRRKHRFTIEPLECITAYRRR